MGALDRSISSPVLPPGSPRPVGHPTGPDRGGSDPPPGPVRVPPGRAELNRGGTGITKLRVLAEPNPVDPGTLVHYSSNFSGGVAPYTYAWTFGDGSANTSSSPGHAYDTPGMYSVRLAVTDSNNSSAVAVLGIYVDAVINASPGAQPDPTEVGLSTQFLPSASGGAGPDFYNWSFGDGNWSDLGAPYHTYSAAGNYTAVMVFADSGGGSARATFGVTVRPRLQMSLLAFPTNPKPGQAVAFSAVLDGGIGPFDYLWAFGDGSPSPDVATVSHTFNAPGPYPVYLRVSDSRSVTVSATVEIDLLLNVTVVGNWSVGAAPLTVGFTSLVRGGAVPDSYYWSFGDGGSNSSPDPSHTFDRPGYYTVWLTLADNAGDIVNATWSVQVTTPGGPLQLSVVALPPEVPIGTAMAVAATITGGVGGYTIVWSSPGLACNASAWLSEVCDSRSGGVFPVTVTATDSVGAVANATVDVRFGLPPVTVVPTFPTMNELALILALVLSTVSIVAAVTVIQWWEWRRPLRPRPPPDREREYSFSDLQEK